MGKKNVNNDTKEITYNGHTYKVRTVKGIDYDDYCIGLEPEELEKMTVLKNGHQREIESSERSL